MNKNEIVEPHTRPQNTSLPFPKPFTAEWTLRRIRRDPELHALRALQSITHPERSQEATLGILQTIKELNDQTALAALKLMQESKRYIRGRKGHQLNLSVVLKTLEDQRAFRTTALLDSGCTGSCINRQFVNKHHIPTQRMPIPIPVYNADGTRNQAGPITEMAELVLAIGEHQERIQLAVTNLGSTDLFIGYEWLRFHNPNIDWERGNLVLN